MTAIVRNSIAETKLLTKLSRHRVTSVYDLRGRTDVTAIVRNSIAETKLRTKLSNVDSWKQEKTALQGPWANGWL